MRRLGLLLLACLLASACQETAVPIPSPDPADPNGEIATVAAGEPDTIDPQKESFASEIGHTMMVFEPLLTFDPMTLRPIPAAARALPVVSDDGLTVTFTLRDGLLYSDGAPVTGADFVDGWKRLCDPNVSGDYAFVGYVITGCGQWNVMDPRRATVEELAAARRAVGVAAPDLMHVVFTLTRPAPYFLAIAALWVGVPVRSFDVASGGVKWTEPATFIGNGPFKLTEWKHNERLVFERNDRYRAPAKIKRWTKVMIPEQAVATAAFRNGELDVAPAGREADAIAAPGSCTFYIGFNTQKAPFDDIAVRTAFARSLDRDAFIRDVLDLPGRPAMSLLPPGVPGSDPADRTQSFDPIAARALLAGSRYAGQLPPVRFTYAARPPSQQAARVRWAVSQWKDNLGVMVTEDALSPLGSRLVTRPEQVPQLFVLGWCSDYPDPQDWLSTIFHGGSTVTHVGYASVEFDSLVDRADVERDPGKRLDLYKEAQRVLTRDAPVAFLYSTEVRYLVSPRLRGYALTASDWEFGQFTLAAMYLAKPGF
ncbi:MAG: peptide ABC transporter substrate-binding protein [Chloroflexota bacterium]|nr:peptide ABC transporter substrate-binding protein [Chloroflexota bacterium]